MHCSSKERQTGFADLGETSVGGDFALPCVEDLGQAGGGDSLPKQWQEEQAGALPKAGLQTGALDGAVFDSLRSLLPAQILTQTYTDFLTQTEDRLTELAAAEQDRASLREAAHAMRGTAGMLGACRIAALAGMLERDTPLSPMFVEQLLEALRLECARLRHCLGEAQVCG